MCQGDMASIRAAIGEASVEIPGSSYDPWGADSLNSAMIGQDYGYDSAYEAEMANLGI